MDGIFFLFLAFLTVLASTKLSYYGDILGKQSKFGSAFVGGILIAAITSLPEFVTSISAVVINNPTLSFGDILGSNMFNIFVLAVYNIYFFRKDVFKNTKRKYILECLILIFDYIFIVLGSNNIFINIVSFVLFFLYVIYMYSVFKYSEEEEDDDLNQEEYVIVKFIFTAIILIFLSILLTIQADNITREYPNFSSSTIGAILLGITTSLPEVVTTFALLKLNNFNMAISNMLGSNIFNFLVLSVSDTFIKQGHIYSYADMYSRMYVIGGLSITFLFLLTLAFKPKNKLFYFLISIIISIIYLYVWYLQFI